MKTTKEKVMQITGVRLPKSVYDEVAALAAANERTVVGQVTFLVKWALAEQARQAAARSVETMRRDS